MTKLKIKDTILISESRNHSINGFCTELIFCKRHLNKLLFFNLSLWHWDFLACTKKFLAEFLALIALCIVQSAFPQSLLPPSKPTYFLFPSNNKILNVLIVPTLWNSTEIVYDRTKNLSLATYRFKEFGRFLRALFFVEYLKKQMIWLSKSVGLARGCFFSKHPQPLIFEAKKCRRHA